MQNSTHTQSLKYTNRDPFSNWPASHLRWILTPHGVFEFNPQNISADVPSALPLTRVIEVRALRTMDFFGQQISLHYGRWFGVVQAPARIFAGQLTISSKPTGTWPPLASLQGIYTVSHDVKGVLARYRILVRPSADVTNQSFRLAVWNGLGR